MITFECPYCGETMIVWLDDEHIGQFEKVECDDCTRHTYVRHSRYDVMVLTEEEWNEGYADKAERA